MSIPEDLKKQLDQSRPVQITQTGEIVKTEETVTNNDGRVVDRQSGQEVTQLKEGRWYAWYDSNPGRLLEERQAMERRFPQFNMHVTKDGLTWDGLLRTRSGTSYRVAIVYPSNFPSKSPAVFIIDPSVKSEKHMYGDGSLCLYFPDDRTWQPNTTAVTIAAMAATWLWCYEYHRSSCPDGIHCDELPCSHWPGIEAPH